MQPTDVQRCAKLPHCRRAPCPALEPSLSSPRWRLEHQDWPRVYTQERSNYRTTPVLLCMFGYHVNNTMNVLRNSSKKQSKVCQRIWKSHTLFKFGTKLSHTSHIMPARLSVHVQAGRQAGRHVCKYAVSACNKVVILV